MSVPHYGQRPNKVHFSALKSFDEKTDLSTDVLLSLSLKDKISIRFYLKGQGHVTVNKLVISRIYIVSHTWAFCSVQILVDGVNPH